MHRLDPRYTWVWQKVNNVWTFAGLYLHWLNMDPTQYNPTRQLYIEGEQLKIWRGAVQSLAEQSNRGVLLGIGVASLPDVPRQYEPWEDHTRSGTFQTVVSNILIIMQISSPHFGHFGLERLFILSSSHVLFSWYWPAKLRWRKSQFQSVLSWFY